MNKFTGFFILIVSLLLFITLPVHAQYGSFTVHDFTNITAEVTVEGTAATQMSIVIRNISDDLEHTKIEWTNVEFPYDLGWQAAAQYADIDYACSLPRWFIALTTENTNSAIADPRFKGAPSGAAGLINTATSNDVLPLVWQIKEDTSLTPVISPPDTVGSELRFTNTGWIWKFIIDKGNDATFTDTTANTNAGGGVDDKWGPETSDLPVNYYTVPICFGMNQGAEDPPGDPYGNDHGILWGGGPWERGASAGAIHRYVYWGAGFDSASMVAYRTTAIKFDLVID